MLFLIYHGFEEYNGISKKIKYQMEAFRKCGFTTHVCYLTDQQMHKRRWIDDYVIKDYGDTFKAKILKRIDFKSIVDYVNGKEFHSFMYDTITMQTRSPFIFTANCKSADVK